MSYYGPRFTNLTKNDDCFLMYDGKKKIEVYINISENGLECINCESLLCDHVLFVWFENYTDELLQHGFPNPLHFDVTKLEKIKQFTNNDNR